MLSSVRNIHSEILQVFTENSKSLTIPSTPNDIIIPVEYTRKSGQTLAEMSKEAYPKAVIWDYFPEPDPDWTQLFQRTVQGYHDFTGTDNTAIKAFLVAEPLRFRFNYDFSFFVKSPADRWAVLEYMTKKYADGGAMILNKFVLPGDDIVGDVVGFKMVPTEIPRRDGIYEMTFAFMFKIMVAIQDEEEVNLVQQFTLNIKPVNKP